VEELASLRQEFRKLADKMIDIQLDCPQTAAAERRMNS
jgi:hypothetical protein